MYSVVTEFPHDRYSDVCSPSTHQRIWCEYVKRAGAQACSATTKKTHKAASCPTVPKAAFYAPVASLFSACPLRCLPTIISCRIESCPRSHDPRSMRHSNSAVNHQWWCRAFHDAFTVLHLLRIASGCARHLLCVVFMNRFFVGISLCFDKG